MIAVVLGTRPEIIKMSPIIRECEARNLDYFILHSGQHYSYDMDRAFFEDLELPKPKYNLDVGSGTHAGQMFACFGTWENPYGDGMAGRMIVTICGGLPSRGNNSVVRERYVEAQRSEAQQ